MKKLSVLLLLLLFSCSDHEELTYYTYHNTTVTRIDRGNQVFFYPGKFNEDDSLPKNYIMAEYRGFDGIMDGFLILNDNGNAEIVRIADHFEEVGHDDRLTLKHFRHNIDMMEWEETIKGHYENVSRICDNKVRERDINKEHKSAVVTDYVD